MTKEIKLPGLIDPHVHLRDPGQTHKEDFLSGTSAALAGGFNTVIDMPNNLEPITTLERLEFKISEARKKAVCDIGFHFGTLGDNFSEFKKVEGKVKGLKIYLNVTTGNYIIDKSKLLEIYKAWPGTTPILLHAEDDVSDSVWQALTITKKTTHICHVSSKRELEFVIKAKDAGLPLTCGVTPHHLFLTDKDVQALGPYGLVKPFIKSQADQDFLWQNLDYIDIFESDHAPHTREEKDSANPPFGLPGLETTLGLLLKAESDGKLTLDQLIARLHDNSARIFNVPVDEQTCVIVDRSEWVLENENLFTKAGWSPFAGKTLGGRVTKVVQRGETVYENGKILTSPGSGQILY